jgi:hypothetical protein
MTEPRNSSLHKLRPISNGTRQDLQDRIGVPVLDVWVRVEDLPDPDGWLDKGKGWGKISH